MNSSMIRIKKSHKAFTKKKKPILPKRAIVHKNHHTTIPIGHVFILCEQQRKHHNGQAVLFALERGVSYFNGMIGEIATHIELPTIAILERVIPVQLVYALSLIKFTAHYDRFARLCDDFILLKEKNILQIIFKKIN